MNSLAQADRYMDTPPVTKESIAAAKAACERERAEAKALGVLFGEDGRCAVPETRTEQVRRLEAIETLTLIVRAYGVRRVQTWVTNIDALSHQP